MDVPPVLSLELWTEGEKVDEECGVVDVDDDVGTW